MKDIETLINKYFEGETTWRRRTQATTFLCRRACTGTSGGISPDVRFLRSGTEGTCGNLR